MRTLLRNYWVKLRASLWFIPALMSAGAVALSAIVGSLDARSDAPPPWIRILSSGSAEGSQAVLSAIAGSMIGVAGVVFSITIVALQLASSQFGPRLLRGFMKDVQNQAVLGTFLATFIYCLLGLRRIGPSDPASPTPELTVGVGILLALASLFVLILFIHHIATSIQADTIIAKVSMELHRAIDHMYPDELGLDAREASGAPRLPEGFEREARRILAEESGYLQAIDQPDLLELAVREDLVLRLACRPGDYVAAGDVLALAWPPGREEAEVETAVRAAFILGRKRTEEQDVEFSVDQLVEVASRSLSPGVNDPFTAIACVDRLSGALARLARRDIPSPHRLDEEGRLRVVVDRADFEGIVDDAFDQIRQHARNSVAVTLRLLEAIARIAPHCPPARRAVLLRHVEKVMETSRLAPWTPHDEADLERRRQAALSALNADAADA